MYKPYVPEEDLNKCYFFDDFFGALYDNVQWSTVTSGTGSTTTTPTPNIGGQVLLTAGPASGRYRELRQDADAFSLATAFEVTWRAKLNSTADCRATFGVSTNTSNLIQWVYDSSLGTNWKRNTILATVSTIEDALREDTGLAQAADTNWHEFKIMADSTLAHFFLDGMPMGSITTNLPTGNLGPHSRITSLTTSSKTVNIDFALIWGRRILPVD